MKRAVLLTLILFLFSVGYSQSDELLKDYRKLILANDSLQKTINHLNDSITLLNTRENEDISRLSEINDSLHEQVIKSINDSIIRLNKDNTDLKKEIESLESTIASLEKKKIKIELDNLKDELASQIGINEELQNTVHYKNQEIEGLTKQKEEKDKILELIEQSYNKETFDELILSSSLSTIQKDILIIMDSTDLRKKLLDLEKFFIAEQVLYQKYDEKKVTDALEQIQSIEQTELVKNLKARLSNYAMCNEELKATIQSILIIDNKWTAETEFTEKDKMVSIMKELADYFYNYKFNFSDYPYLSKIVLKIMKVKQKDVNADIAILKEKL